MIKPAGMSSQCDRYIPSAARGEYLLRQCPNQATRRLTVEQLGEVYTWKRCESCYQLLVQEIEAGRPAEILDNEVLGQVVAYGVKPDRCQNCGAILNLDSTCPDCGRNS